MDRVDTYRKIVKELIEEYSQPPPANEKIDLEIVFDIERDHYQLMAVGWQGKRRVHGCVIHIDIKGNKVWLQQDSTDAEIASELVERGIPKTRIVLGFQPERHRKYSGFSIN